MTNHSAGKHLARANHPQIPEINSKYWSFTLGGLVDIPLCLSFADLQAYPRVARECLLTCRGNPPGGDHVYEAHWQGAALTDLLTDLNIQPAVNYAHLYAADGYTTCIEFSDLKQSLLAYHQDEQPLTPEQGYPVRLIAPDLYGYKLPKHVQHIILSDQPLLGTWEKRGWPLPGRLTPSAAFISPHDQAQIYGAITLRGIAFGGEKAIESVEINVDDGPWMPVSVTDYTPYRLMHWSTAWQPAVPGAYQLQVRVKTDQNIEIIPHALIVQVRSV